MEVSIHGGTPIDGWFTMENPVGLPKPRSLGSCDTAAASATGLERPAAPGFHRQIIMFIMIYDGFMIGLWWSIMIYDRFIMIYDKFIMYQWDEMSQFPKFNQ